jgi:hypothetical protein
MVKQEGLAHAGRMLAHALSGFAPGGWGIIPPLCAILETVDRGAATIYLSWSIRMAMAGRSACRAREDFDVWSIPSAFLNGSGD